MTKPLDYAAPSVANESAPKSPVFALIMCLVAGPLVLFTATRIEYLNAEAGGVLPRQSEGKWRVSHVQSEQRWRELEAILTKDPTLVSRPLTAAEDMKMRTEVEDAIVNGTLRDVVGSWGIFQYLLVPPLVLESITLLARRRTRLHAMIAVTALLVGIGGGVLMFARGYFTSVVD